MAALSLMSFSDDPLSNKMAQTRLKLIRQEPVQDNAFRNEFMKNRLYKLSSGVKYTTQDLCLAYNMTE